MTGTFTGDLAVWGKRYGANPPAWAPTGRRVDIEGVDLYEFRDGLISRWDYRLRPVRHVTATGTACLRADSRMVPVMVRVQRMMARLRRRRGR